MEQKSNEHSRKFESIHTLIRQLHGSSSDLSRRKSNDETSTNIPRSASDRSVSSSLNTLPILEIEKPLRKRSLFEGAFRIPIPRLMITGPHSSPVDSLCTLEESPHRRFSFGNFRRHSHSSVRIYEFSLLFYFFVPKELLKN